MRLGVIFLLLCCFTSLFSENKMKDKIYLHENQITVHSNQLFVFIENQWETASALFSDANGVYVLGRKWYEPWDCSYCGAANPPTNLTCWNCGR
jgi:hypothetical protein